MYIIIFCQENDLVADSLCRVLLEKGGQPVRVVTDMELAFASWLHEAGSDGLFFTRIRLRDGFVIEPNNIKKLVNRIPYFQMPHFINQADRAYAEMEIYALYISFLRSLEEKLAGGMPVGLINLAAETNQLWFYAMAVKAGMDVPDQQFTTSPRWWQPKALAAMSPQKRQTAIWHKPSPHLVWENKPVLYNEPFTTLVKVEVVNDKIFWPGVGVQGKTWREKIKKFSALTRRTVYTLTLAEIKGRYKFYEIDLRPKTISAAAAGAWAASLISKNRN